MKPADLGLTGQTTTEPVAVTDNDTTAAPAAVDKKSVLVAGSVLAQALYSVWSGELATVVDSPPGAGKTTLLVDLIGQLIDRTDLSIVVATPTRVSAQDVSARFGDRLGLKNDMPQVILGVRNLEPTSDNVSKGGGHKGIDYAERSVLVRTVASCKMSAPKCDVMIFDEAYQSTFADISAAAEGAQQIVMVGDPGQIGPVVQSSDKMFATKRVSPDMRAPEVFRAVHDCTLLNFDTTYRLGADTVHAIAPLYDFGFDSCRPDRWLEDHQGNPVDEIEAVRIPDVSSYTNMDSVAAAVDQAHSMVGMTLAEAQPDGTVTRRVLLPGDIAIVAPHNAQVTAATAMLSARKLDGITAGTADSLQGGQWHAVVAMDPLIGHETAGSHQLSPGRLCVMASRHMTHLTWVHSKGWADALLDDEIDGREADLGRIVRSRLTGGRVTDVAL